MTLSLKTLLATASAFFLVTHVCHAAASDDEAGPAQTSPRAASPHFADEKPDAGSATPTRSTAESVVWKGIEGKIKKQARRNFIDLRDFNPSKSLSGPQKQTMALEATQAVLTKFKDKGDRLSPPIELDLTYNGIDDATAIKIVKALVGQNAVHALYLKHNSISAEAIAEMRKILATQFDKMKAEDTAQRGSAFPDHTYTALGQQDLLIVDIVPEKEDTTPKTWGGLVKKDSADLREQHLSGHEMAKHPGPATGLTHPMGR